MSLPRTRLDKALRTPEGWWILSEEESHHLVRVRRCAEGDLVEGLLPGWHLTLELRYNEGQWYGIERQRRSEGGRELSVTLLVALLKGDAFEHMLRQATELGATHIVPLACERSIPRITPARMVQKLDRWGRILEESTKQCGRTTPPEIASLLDFKDLPFLDLPSQRLAAIIDGEASPLGTVSLEDAVAYAVGPEGDFTPKEKNLLKKAGFRSVSLGPHILKAGTAVAAGMSFFTLLHEAQHGRIAP